MKTGTGAGPNPAWNQQLELNFRPQNNDLSPEAMARVQDCLHLHLFDQVCVDLLEDERERSSRVHQRLENKWLGSLAIPFSSLYQNTRIEGTFRLHSPAVLLGYERLGTAATQAGWRPGTPTEGGHGVEKDATYLNIYLTIQPALHVPEPVREKLDSEETESALAAAERWEESVRAVAGRRAVSPLVLDTQGRSVLLSRYLRPLAPPSSVLAREEPGQQQAEAVAWFVSLLPYTASNAFFPGLRDVWPTSDQFLKMMLGTEAEHAVLLTNYMSGLGRTAYLVLGRGVPEGTTAYCLTVEETGEHWLWNAVTGEHFTVTETFLPLSSVSCVANSTNVWGNLQPAEQPQRLRWHLATAADWLPLFPGPAPSLVSVQPEQLSLSAPDPRAARQLREKIEKMLRDSIMNLRRRAGLRTALNFQGKAVLGKLLPGLEAGRLSQGGGRGLSQEHLAELQRIAASHKVQGFPLHFPYSDLEAISEAVRGTGVHLSREPGVEFALAVQVEAYPGTAMSVWVYVASLVRRR